MFLAGHMLGMFCWSSGVTRMGWCARGAQHVAWPTRSNARRGSRHDESGHERSATNQTDQARTMPLERYQSNQKSDRVPPQVEIFEWLGPINADRHGAPNQNEVMHEPIHRTKKQNAFAEVCLT